MNSSGFSIIKWQSRGRSVTRRSDFTTGGPIVRLGTKCPSIISTWMTLAPPSSAARTCSPRRAKSAERIEGANSIKDLLSYLGYVVGTLVAVYHSKTARQTLIYLSRRHHCRGAPFLAFFARSGIPQTSTPWLSIFEDKRISIAALQTQPQPLSEQGCQRPRPSTASESPDKPPY